MSNFTCTSIEIQKAVQEVIHNIQVVYYLEKLCSSKHWVLLTDRVEDLSFAQSNLCQQVIFIGHAHDFKSKSQDHHKVIFFDKIDQYFIDYLKSYTGHIDIYSFDYHTPIHYLLVMIRQRYLRKGFDYPVKEKLHLIELLSEEAKLPKNDKISLKQALLHYELTQITLPDSLLFKPMLAMNSAEKLLHHEVVHISAKSSVDHLSPQVSQYLSEYYLALTSRNLTKISHTASLFYCINLFYCCLLGFYQKDKKGATFAKNTLAKLSTQDAFTKAVSSIISAFDKITSKKSQHRLIPATYLEPGMVFAEDILDDKCNIFFERDKKITQEIIDKIHRNVFLMTSYESFKVNFL